MQRHAVLMRSFLTGVWRAAPTRWVLLAWAVVTTTGWILDTRPRAAVWGPVGTWVAGAVTAIGLICAAIEIRASASQREDERRRREGAEEERRAGLARAVAISSIPQERVPGRWFLKYKIMNGGDYPVDNAVLVVAHPGAGDLGLQRAALQLVLGTLLPKQLVEDEVEVDFAVAPFFGELTSLGSVLFTDSWEQTWLRGPMRLQRVDQPARTS